MQSELGGNRMRVGILGAGNVARLHLAGYIDAGAEIAAVADVDMEKAVAMADPVGARAFSDRADLLALPDIDAVSVCLPNNEHHAAAADVLAAGKHVLCEKPMTTTLQDARDLVSLVRASDRIFQIAYMKRFIPAFRAAREALSGIGEILSATVKVFSNIGRSWVPGPNFFPAK
jgi:predicted dehydrogenase